MNKDLDKRKIGVFLGGSSSERNISLKSGKAVYGALKGRGMDVIPLDIKEERVVQQIKKSDIDLAFIAMHGKFGEDGALQKKLEFLKIPYSGSGVTASRLAMDKVASRELFIKGGIRVPSYSVVSKIREFSLNGVECPIVVKPKNQGSSKGLTIIDSSKKLNSALEFAFKFDSDIIVESYIKGREITVGIFKEKPLPVIEIIPNREYFDYKAKYKSGMTDYIVPARIGPRKYRAAQEIGLACHKLLGCRDFSRVDMILSDKGDIFVLEVNTIPGFTATSLLPKAAMAAGIDFSRLCIDILKLALRRRRTTN